MSSRQGIIIGLCGGSGSGKSSLADLLRARLLADATVLRQDWYYHDCSHLTPTQRARRNFDHPEAIDLQAFAMDLQRLQAGLAIHPPRYCFSTHCSRAGTQHVAATPIIIAEGLFLYNSRQLSTLFDLKVFIHADSDIRLLRRMQRDVEQRGRSLASVGKQYLETVKPMHETHVEPNKQRADMVIDPANLEQLDACADVIARRITQHSEHANEHSHDRDSAN